MAKTRTTRWDPVAHLDSEEAIAAYLAAALESLYKALSPDGNPELATVLRVIAALGLKLQAVPAK